MRRKRLRNIEKVLKVLGFAIICVLTLFPLYWMITVSLLPEREVIKSNPHLFPLPRVATLKSYQEIFTKYEVPKYLLNSVLIVLLASVITLFPSFAVAYALVKHRFRFKRFLLYLILWLITLPWVIYVLPIFLIVSPLGLLDTHLLMILLYGFSGIPLFSWFASPYVHAFPDELIDAGRLDGCSEWGVVVRIVLPALKNALIALFILRFVWAYNDLLYSLCFTFHRAKMIMPALLEFPGYLDIPYAKMAAGGFIAVLPILVIVVVFQKYVVSGLVGQTFK